MVVGLLDKLGLVLEELNGSIKLEPESSKKVDVVAKSGHYLFTNVKEFTPDQKAAITNAIMEADKHKNSETQKITGVEFKKAKDGTEYIEVKGSIFSDVDLEQLAHELKKYKEQFKQVKVVGEPEPSRTAPSNQVSDKDKEEFRQFMGAFKDAAATIQGQRTGITARSDFERVILDMADIKMTPEKMGKITAKTNAGPDGTMEMNITGLDHKDVLKLIEQLDDKFGVKAEVIEEKGKPSKITVKVSEVMDKMMNNGKMKAHLEELGKTNPDLIRELQYQSNSREDRFESPAERSAREKLENQPANFAKAAQPGGTIKKISAFGTEMKGADGKSFQIRGMSDLIIESQGKNPPVIKAEYNGVRVPLVEQEIQATIELESGKTKKVVLKVDKDSQLTEVRAATTPSSGKAGSAAQSK